MWGSQSWLQPPFRRLVRFVDKVAHSLRRAGSTHGNASFCLQACSHERKTTPLGASLGPETVYGEAIRSRETGRLPVGRTRRVPLPTCSTSSSESIRGWRVFGKLPSRLTSPFIGRETRSAAPASHASGGDRGETPRGIEEGSRPSGRLAGETACPTASIRFRGRKAHPNRVEKPPAFRPVGRLKHAPPTDRQHRDFAGRRPIQTGREAYRTLSVKPNAPHIAEHRG
jgi:hypothetical protein